MSRPVCFKKFETIIQIGRIYFFKSPLFDRKFHFSHLLQYKNFDRRIPELGACAIKTRGQKLPRVGHLILPNLCWCTTASLQLSCMSRSSNHIRWSNLYVQVVLVNSTIAPNSHIMQSWKLYTHHPSSVAVSMLSFAVALNITNRNTRSVK